MKRLLLLLFLVCTQCHAATTYYVRSTDGNDSDDGESVGNAWLTIQKAADTITTGSTCLICADGTYLPATTIDFDTNGGGVVFKGCAADGTDDNTVATISGMGGSGYLVALNHASGSGSFYNLRFTQAKSDAFHFDDGSNYRFFNCEIDNATSDGIHVSDSTVGGTLTDCHIHSNGAKGFNQSAATRGNFGIMRCTINGNGGNGLDTEFLYIYNSIVFDNGGVGLSIDGANARVVNTTIFSNSGDGIDCAVQNAGQLIAHNTILRSNGGYGINTSSSDVQHYYPLKNLCSHNNTSGHIDINGGNFPDAGSSSHVYEDPSFVSESGTIDLTPENSNLYKTIAFATGATSYEYIGAIQPQCAGGGGDKYPYPRFRGY